MLANFLKRIIKHLFVMKKLAYSVEVRIFVLCFS